MRRLSFALCVALALCVFPPAAWAAPAPTGAITGRVTNGLSPIAGVTVKVFSLGTPLYFETTEAATDGSFAFPGVPEGGYRLLFQGGTEGYAGQWNGGALWAEDAPTITVGATPVTCDATLTLGGSINGTVSVTPTPYWFLISQPVRPWDITTPITLYRQDGAGWRRMGQLNASALSDSAPQGPFNLKALPPGTYRVGFGGGDVCGRFWPSVVATDPADPAITSIVVTSGSTRDIGTVSLTRAGHINVEALDPWGRTIPYYALAVEAFRTADGPDFRSDNTIMNGGLHWGLLSSLSWVPTSSAGEYAVHVSPYDHLGFRDQWYGGSSKAASATPVHVVDGQDTNITVRLRYVLPFASLSRPAAPASMRHGRLFTVSGSLAPKQPARSKAIKLYFERKEGARWVARKSVTVRVWTSGSRSKYSARISLPSTGSWRIRAYHADSKHAPTFSSWRSITVK